MAKFWLKNRPALLWLVAAVIAFCLGRHLSSRSVDFIVYHQAARSLLAGRTDLYSDTFSWGPPMAYVYPPLFVLLIFPMGWLGFENAFGVWFCLMALTTAAVVIRAYRQWRAQNRKRYVWFLAMLAGPYVVLALHYGNVHLIVVLLTISAVLAWTRGRLWASSFALAVGGAIKIFPLLLVPVFVVRREWALTARVIGFTILLWALPILYFGPQRTMSLYRSWYDIVLRDTKRFGNQHNVDLSLAGAMERCFTRVDYSSHRDHDYPQATLVELPRELVKVVTWGADGIVLGLSLWMCAMQRKAVPSPPSSGAPNGEVCIATAGSIFITAQLLLGPYTPVHYLSGWLLVAAVIPVALQAQNHLGKVLLGIGIVNLLLFAVPGRMSQRALQAYGAFTLLGLSLWAVVLYRGWALARRT